MWGHWKDVESEYESKVNDPWDWVTHFENAVARYTGAKHAIACDSNSNAIRLLLHYFGIEKEVSVPKNTYVSVPNAILNAGYKLAFNDSKWYNMYRIINTPIIDAAVSFYENMFDDLHQVSEKDCMVLSFHHRKILKIGKGGMILTNSDVINDWLRSMIYDGRHKYQKYDEDEFECIGWHMYMTPEDAKKGLELLHGVFIKKFNKSVGSWETYKDLSHQKIFKNIPVKKRTLSINHNNQVILNDFIIHDSSSKKNYTIWQHLFSLRNELSENIKFNKSDWEKSFSNLDLDSFHKDTKFIIYDNIEFWDSKLYNNNKIKFIISFFKKHKRKDDIIIYGNNLDYKNSQFRYEPFPFFLSDNTFSAKKIIKKRKFSKKFLFLGGFPKYHRELVYLHLYDNNILENSYFSWNPSDILVGRVYPDEIEKKMVSVQLDTTDFLEIKNMHDIIPHYYKSFCNIICESFFYQDANIPRLSDVPGIFITEKTTKSFIAGQPFIMVSRPGFLKKLKELGFKTFDKWWDESYDEIEDDNERLETIKSLISEINKKSISEMNTMYSEMNDILKHNQFISTKYRKEYTGLLFDSTEYHSIEKDISDIIKICDLKTNAI